MSLCGVVNQREPIGKQKNNSRTKTLIGKTKNSEQVSKKTNLCGSAIADKQSAKCPWLKSISTDYSMRTHQRYSDADITNTSK